MICHSELFQCLIMSSAKLRLMSALTSVISTLIMGPSLLCLRGGWRRHILAVFPSGFCALCLILPIQSHDLHALAVCIPGRIYPLVAHNQPHHYQIWRSSKPFFVPFCIPLIPSSSWPSRSALSRRPPRWCPVGHCRAEPEMKFSPKQVGIQKEKQGANSGTESEPASDRGTWDLQPVSQEARLADLRLTAFQITTHTNNLKETLLLSQPMHPFKLSSS